MSNFETGRLTAVYTIHGKDTRGKLRYVRESYDQLEWVSPGATKVATFAVPLGFSPFTNDPNYQLGTEAIGREFGYYTLDSIIADRHEHNGKDSFVGLQFFGPI